MQYYIKINIIGVDYDGATAGTAGYYTIHMLCC